MEILNTVTTETSSSVPFWIFIVGVILLIIGILFLEQKEGAGILPLLIGGALIFGSLMVDTGTEIQHEVILKDGYVLNATKYEIIEQRGRIYLIKETGDEHNK
ncbi:hypothetical protein ACFQZE_06310 [Paenibacillus sp. GCM10027627]|uniref:hypothetical protein n=1 Tax=unclassified Paenibacillus TaxID=185978 RepID=UPI00362947DE